MSTRHIARTIVLQSLFEWDFNNGQKEITETLKHVKKEVTPEFDDQNFSLNLIKNIIKNKKEIDKLITKFAPEWPLNQITNVDRNILRIGVYELKLDKEIPPKVAINEAIELAKAFGGDASSKFINGVLGSVYKKMIEGGEKQSLASQGIKEISSGGVIYYKKDDGYYFCLILDAYNKWTFPKGHVEKGESLEETALRELEEETGLKKLKIKKYLGETEIKVHKPNKKSFCKLIKYFLIEAQENKIIIPHTKEIKDVRWFSKKESLDTLGYNNAKEIFNKGLKEMAQK